MAYVSLTIDHRVVDGHQTNAWLTPLRRNAGELAGFLDAGAQAGCACPAANAPGEFCQKVVGIFGSPSRSLSVGAVHGALRLDMFNRAAFVLTDLRPLRAPMANLAAREATPDLFLALTDHRIEILGLLHLLRLGGACVCAIAGKAEAASTVNAKLAKIFFTLKLLFETNKCTILSGGRDQAHAPGSVPRSGRLLDVERDREPFSRPQADSAPQ